MTTLMQVVAWALWFQRSMDRRKWVEPVLAEDEGHWSFDDTSWRAWLLEHAHEPPPVLRQCDCGVYMQLCAWRPCGGLLSNFNDLMKHLHPERRLKALVELKHPLFEYLGV